MMTKWIYIEARNVAEDLRDVLVSFSHVQIEASSTDEAYQKGPTALARQHNSRLSGDFLNDYVVQL